MDRPIKHSPFRISRRQALIVLTGTLFVPRFAPALPTAPFAEDLRLRQTLTVRVSRMSLSDLFQRLEAVLGARLVAEGEDVADQKIDLFARNLPADEVLTAIPSLLNAEGPKGYRWERSGRGPDYRYVLVRDLASRQWEEQHAAEAETRMARLLRERLAAVGSEPFRPDPARRLELPAMRKLLSTLSEAQVERLLTERVLALPSGTAPPEQRPVLKELIDEAVSGAMERRPEQARQIMAMWGPPEKDISAGAFVYLEGDPPEYLVRVGASVSKLWGSSDVCRVADPTLTGPTGSSARAFRWDAASDGPEPVFALPARSRWLMGDVLADIAARSRLSLIADDYTQDWSRLGRIRGAQPLSSWLAAIRQEYGFEAARDVRFLRLRNRHWWLDRRREIPTRLVDRWGRMIRGSTEERLMAAVEVARWAPLAPNYQTLRDRLRVLALYPEMSGTSIVVGDESFTTATSRVQSELLIYDALPPAQQRQVTGPGLTLTWDDMSPASRTLFERRIRYWIEPGLGDDSLRKSSLFIRFTSDQFLVRWLLAGVPIQPGTEEVIAPEPGLDSQRLVGQLLPEMAVEDVAGKVSRVSLRGPLLLYLTPAWPRPIVARREQFPDLQALQQLSTEPGVQVRVMALATDASVAELAVWWKERGLSPPPRSISTDLARRLGVRQQPLVLVVDPRGRVTWAKEGYEAGDEELWQRQLERVSR